MFSRLLTIAVKGAGKRTRRGRGRPLRSSKPQRFHENVNDAWFYLATVSHLKGLQGLRAVHPVANQQAKATAKVNMTIGNSGYP